MSRSCFIRRFKCFAITYLGLSIGSGKEIIMVSFSNRCYDGVDFFEEVEIMLTENRLLTVDELKELEPIIGKLNIKRPEEIVRFIDTHLDKIYDVYLIRNDEKALILKKLEERRFDKAKYDTYFAGHGFAVPEILENVSMGETDYVLMEYVEGADARECSEADAAKIGTELAKIQSHYLTVGGHLESTEYYWNRYLQKYYEKAKVYFEDFDEVWESAKNRFFEAPVTFVHDDLLPINVLIDGKQPWIIDWEIAGMYPYFLDLARFAYVYVNMDNKFFISNESADAFTKAYYEEMKKNSKFNVDEDRYKKDITISAFYQYLMFLDYEKPMEEVKTTIDYKFLSEIVKAVK